MTKRDLFVELTEGFEALANERAGKVTLRQHKVKVQPVTTITPEQLLSIRQKLNISVPVFAHFLRTNPRTFENWEQGRAKPNAQATTLIKLVDKYPDTIKKLAVLA